MRKIVVPTDFSDNALLAATFAVNIAAIFGATIYLLHAMDAATDPILEPIALDSEYLEKYTRQEFDRLRAFRNRITEQHPQVSVELRLSKGLAAGAILEIARKEQAELIVMGTHGSGALKEFFAGGVTSAVIAGSKVPVIAIPPDYRYRKPGALMLATRKFEEDKPALSILIELAEGFKAPVDIVSLADEGESPAEQYADVTWRLNHYLEFLQRGYPYINFRIHQLEGNDLQESIERYCTQHNVRMVAVISHPRSFIDKLCRRNNTRRTVFHSHIPVLVLPAPVTVES